MINQINLKSISLIEQFAGLARTVGVESLIVENNIIRGMSEDNIVSIIQRAVEPGTEFGFMGIADISTFIDRFNVVKDLPQCEITCAYNGDSVSCFNFKAKGVKLDCRAKNPTTIRAARRIVDDMSFILGYDQDLVQTLRKGATAMRMRKTKEDPPIVSIVKNVDGMKFEFRDEDRDSFALDIPLDIISDETGIGFFAKNYRLDRLITILQKGNNVIYIGADKGFLKVDAGEIFDIYLSPIVDE